MLRVTVLCLAVEEEAGGGKTGSAIYKKSAASEPAAVDTVPVIDTEMVKLNDAAGDADNVSMQCVLCVLILSRSFVRSFVPSFVLCGATMEAVAGMLINSTALRPITTRPIAHPQRACSVCRCCAATVVMTGRVCESLVPYLVVPGQAVRFT